MRVAEQFASPEAAVPRAVLALENLNGAATYHEAYGARHPLAAYRVSLSNVASRLVVVLDELPTTRPAGPERGAADTNREQRLLEAADHLLDALMEHMGDCGSILRSMFPASDEARHRTVYSKYKGSVEPYRKHIGAIVNYIKHNQGRLCSVSFAWLGGSIPGYYVEGPIGSGVGPAQAIHGEEPTAFSFNRDVPFHICSLFAVGDRLAAALRLADSRIGLGDSFPSTEPSSSDLSKALRLASALPRVFFPDEVKKPMPLIQLDGHALTIELPSNAVKPSGPPLGSKVLISARGDGVTRSFRLPYLRR
jgi:hypothetical protein